ncbi:MAG TPA: hypothetical protein IAC82_12095 [Candidatus Merdivicinus intestinigallinarum]|nr:hypothetical protein [Candidatus Merdivicinus intestinigallinarum]
MDSSNKSIEEILLEAGIESGAREDPAGSADDVDVDSLLASLIQEKKSPPAAKPKENRPPEEDPTKVFYQRAKRRTAPKTPVQEPRPEPKQAANLPPIFQNFQNSYTPPSEEPGKFQIDVDKIRAEQPAPQAIPAQKLPEEEEPQRVRPAEKVREKPLEPVQNGASAQFAPAFRRLGQKLNEAPYSAQAGMLGGASRSAMILGLCLLAAAVCCLGLTLTMEISRLQNYGSVPGRVPLGILLAVGAAGGAVSWEILESGITSLFKLEPNREIPLAAGYLLCLLQTLGQLLFPKGLANVNIQFYMPVGLMLLGFGWLSRAMTLKTAAINAKFALSDYDKYVCQPVDNSRLAADMTKGLMEGYSVPVINRPTDLLGDFLPISLGSDSSDSAGRTLGLIGIVAGVAMAGFTFLFTQHKNLALTAAAAMLLVLAPMTNLFATAHPLRRGARLLNRVSALANGEQCTQDGGEVNAVVIDAADLLPSDCVTLSGIKTSKGMRIDEAILDAASILVQSGSILSHIFLEIIGGRKDLLRKVDSISCEDGMGITAWIGKKRVLIGNRELLESHGVRTPSEAYEQKFRKEGCDLVYLSSAGNLTAVFVITLEPSQDADNAIQMLLENDILMTVHTVDSIVTKNRLAQLYYCEPSCFKILPARLEEEWKDRRTLVKMKPATLANNGSFLSMAASLMVSRRMRVMMMVSNIIQLVSVLLGAGLVLMLAVMESMSQFSAPVLCGYLLLWLGVDLLIQKLVRI